MRRGFFFEPVLWAAPVAKDFVSRKAQSQADEVSNDIGHRGGPAPAAQSLDQLDHYAKACQAKGQTPIRLPWPAQSGQKGEHPESADMLELVYALKERRFCSCRQYCQGKKGEPGGQHGEPGVYRTDFNDLPRGGGLFTVTLIFQRFRGAHVHSSY